MKVMKAPVSLEVDITHRCNLRCRYCSHFTSAGDVEKDLPTGEWIRFFEELNRASVFYITLQGGEPFCRSDLEEIIEGIVRNRMRFSILSNGTLITDEKASFLSATGRCNEVQISIDGSSPESHDVFRGKGNFALAVRGIKFLQKYGVPVSVRVTVHRKNVRELEPIAKLLFEDIGLPSFSTNSASYMGLCRKNADMVQLTPLERSLAMKSLMKLNEKYEGRISADAGPLADGRTWQMMEKARREAKPNLDGRGYLTACNGPMEKIGIRADGVIVPCILMSHIQLGRINKDDFQKVWSSHPELVRLRSRHNIPLSDFEFCNGCDYINYCTGNCPALAYTILKTDNHPSPDACLRRFLQDGGRLPERGEI